MSELPKRYRAPANTGWFVLRHQEAPRAVGLAESLRLAINPVSVVVLIHASRVSAAVGVIARAGGADETQAAALSDWLSKVKATQTLAVPMALRRELASFRVLAAPIATPFEAYGVVATPVALGNDALRMRLEAGATDFALRLELYQRHALVKELSNPDSGNATKQNWLDQPELTAETKAS